MRLLCCRCVMLGDEATGKSTLLNEFQKIPNSQKSYNMTSFVESHHKTIIIPNNNNNTDKQDDQQSTIQDDVQIELFISDFSGSQIWTQMRQEYFATLTKPKSDSSLLPLSYAFICFSYSNRDSFLNAQHWIHEIDTHLKQVKSNEISSNNKPILYGVIVGLKSDFKSSSDITVDEINAFIAKNSNFAFFETSNKIQDSIDVPFNFITQQFYEKHADS